MNFPQMIFIQNDSMEDNSSEDETLTRDRMTPNIQKNEKGCFSYSRQWQEQRVTFYVMRPCLCARSQDNIGQSIVKLKVTLSRSSWEGGLVYRSEGKNSAFLFTQPWRKDCKGVSGIAQKESRYRICEWRWLNNISLEQDTISSQSLQLTLKPGVKIPNTSCLRTSEDRSRLKRSITILFLSTLSSVFNLTI